MMRHNKPEYIVYALRKEQESGLMLDKETLFCILQSPQPDTVFSLVQQIHSVVGTQSIRLVKKLVEHEEPYKIVCIMNEAKDSGLFTGEQGCRNICALLSQEFSKDIFEHFSKENSCFVLGDLNEQQIAANQLIFNELINIQIQSRLTYLTE